MPQANMPGWLIIGGLFLAVVMLGRLWRLERKQRSYIQAHDPKFLTLHNQWAVETRIEELYRKGLAFAVLHLDLDGFKALNDTLGHGKGDQVITLFAQRVDEPFQRVGDMVARLGGDEFLILLDPAVGRGRNGALEHQIDAASHTVAEIEGYLRKVVRHYEREASVEDVVTARFGISVGSAMSTSHPDAQTLIEAADRAMQAVKERRGTARR